MNGERKTKIRGMHWSPAKMRWVVRVSVNGQRIEVGQFRYLPRAKQAHALAFAGDLDVARTLFEQEKAEIKEAERAAARERLAARRQEKIERDGHPYTRTYPHDEARAGAVVFYRGQRFRCTGQRETLSARRAVPIVLDVWRSHCATCGEPYTFELLPKRSETPEPFWPVRRCETHRRKGARISSASLHWRAGEDP